MRWADFKAAVGQRINLEGIASSIGIISKDKHMLIPHISVPDIRYIDWAELKKRGFKGVVFDKDNTITVPYSVSLWEPLQSSMEQCKSMFGNNIAVFSNSAGKICLKFLFVLINFNLVLVKGLVMWMIEYDSDDSKAKTLEDAVGIKVIRHRMKKPAGTAEDIEQNFGCESSRLIMVGDRPFTDIAFGNRNGFFTVLTEPLSLAEEPLIVRRVCRLIFCRKTVTFASKWTESTMSSDGHVMMSRCRVTVVDYYLCWMI